MARSWIQLKTFLSFLLVAASVAISALYTNCGRASLGTMDPIDLNNANRKREVLGFCPSGQVAIGVGEDGNVVCSTLISADGRQCPDGYALYDRQENPDKVVCLPVSDLDRPGTYCPPNRYLGSVEGSNVLCEPAPGVFPDLSCPTGQYVIGRNGNAPICRGFPSGQPQPLICPPGQKLVTLANGQPQCEALNVNNGPAVTCADGQALVGFNGSQAQCQRLFDPSQFGSAYPEQICPAGQMAQDKSGSGLSCVQAPARDLVPLCRSGQYLAEFTATGFVCRELPKPSRGPHFNGTCPPGESLAGFSSNEPSCRRLSDQPNPLPGLCPNGHYPVGVSAGRLICLPYQPTQERCTPGTQALCSVNNGLGLTQCQQDGRSYGACEAQSCSAGYELSGGSCVPARCSPGSTAMCAVSNGTGVMACGQDQRFGSCVATTCSAGFRLNAGQCEALSCQPGSTLACQVSNGTGIRLCGTDGAAYGSCLLLACDAGWTLENGACVDRLAPRIAVSQEPNSPEVGSPQRVAFSVTENESGLDRVQCQVDSAAFVDCVSPVDNSSLQPGIHFFRIKARDKAGNEGLRTLSWETRLCQAGAKQICPISDGKGERVCAADGRSYSACQATECNPGFKLIAGQCKDDVAPDVAVQVKPDRLQSSESHRFEFTASDSASGLASVECQIDARPYEACSSPKIYNDIEPGAHQFRVRARDKAANEKIVVVDFTTQACTAGSSMMCPITNGQGQKTCSQDGTSFGPCNLVSCNSGYSSVAGACVDQGLPVVVITAGPSGEVTETQSRFEFTAADSASGLDRVECRLDGGPWEVCTSPRNVTVTVGQHLFGVRATDRAGNSALAERSWSVRALRACPLPWGGSLASGQSVRAFKASAPLCGVDTSCVSEMRACVDGVLSGSFTKQSCTEGPCDPGSCPSGQEWSGGQCVVIRSPTVEVVSTPQGQLAGTDSRIEFRVVPGSASVQSVQCSLNGGTARACSSPLVLPGLSAGQQSLTITARDAKARSGQAVASWLIGVCRSGAQQSCAVSGGAGRQVCNADGMAWGACEVMACDAGHYLKASQCVLTEAGFYSPAGDTSRYACTNLPVGHKYIGQGASANNCPSVPLSCSESSVVNGVGKCLRQQVSIPLGCVGPTNGRCEVNFNLTDYRAQGSVGRVTFRLRHFDGNPSCSTPGTAVVRGTETVVMGSCGLAPCGSTSATATLSYNSASSATRVVSEASGWTGPGKNACLSHITAEIEFQ